jgi:hypothetical protein
MRKNEMTADPYNLSRIDSYRYLEQVSTRYSDQDAMGHINNVAYAAYIEAGRLGYFLNLMATSGKIDLNYVWQTSTSIIAPKCISPTLFL